MGSQIIVGPITQGLQNNVKPYYVNDDSFPSLINAYTWRGAVKRKRGTSFLNRVQRYFNSASTSYTSTSTFSLSSGAGNLISNASWTLEGSIIPSTVSFVVGANTYTDNGLGTLIGSPAGSGTINYATGAITVSGGGAGVVSSVVFRYYPSLPIMGIRNFNTNRGSDALPTSLAFDKKYSYNIETSSPFRAYDVSFYKNPNANAITLPGYTRKSASTPLTWAIEDYQLTRSANYQNAIFVSNGVTKPFSTTNFGMQYKAVTNVSAITAGPPAIATFTILSHGLSVGDFLFFNEFNTATIDGLNFQTGYVTNVVNSDNVTVEFPTATFSGAGGAVTGIAQYLTNTSDSTKSCLRIYDGNPTNANVTSPTLSGVKGWVNYCPPLSFGDYSISNLPADQYYLIGAVMIVPFKDRILFFGPIVQTSTTGSQQYLKDTVIYSQNGTPYYTCTFTGDIFSADTIFTPLLTPTQSSATKLIGARPSAFFEDKTGYGGFSQSGLNEAIYTAVANEDVLILGMESNKAKLVYTGSDIIPFQFFLINSEFGDTSPLAALQLDKGVISKSDNGYIITTQNDSGRVDLQIPDEVFQVRGTNNGQSRVIAARDYINEWIYFSYPSNAVNTKYPTRTLQYNYRENSWGLFTETFTAYGEFIRRTGYTWATIGTKYATWSVWNEPWNAGTSTVESPEIIAGTQHGFIVSRGGTTSESPTLQIEAISNDEITCTDHALSSGEYIKISDCIGTVSSLVNDKPFMITRIDANTIRINAQTSGTYLGGGTITKLYKPFIQSKAFPTAWSMGRKTRLGTQRYLFTTTPSGEVTVYIYLSQNYNDPYNNGPVIPSNDVTNGALIYASKVYTCAEGTNIGLTAPNVNLNLLSGIRSSQLWHRVNTSLIGDTVQVAITLSNDQMLDETFAPQTQEIELHSMILDVYPSQMLA